MSRTPKVQRPDGLRSALSKMPGLSSHAAWVLANPELAMKAFKQVAASLIVAQDWEGLYLHFCGDSMEAWVKQDAAVRVQAIRQQIDLRAARSGRAKGAAQARAARSAKRQAAAAELKERILGLHRREALSCRAIALRLGVSRQRVAKILARSGS